jgi:hypothetical protein
MRLRRARPEGRLQFIVLVTYGRTGSTALQACLNCLPGVRIRGENYAALRGLRQYVQSLAETASRHHSGRPDHPWFGSARLDPSDVVADLQRHVVEHLLRPAADTRVLGFKEIRYEPGHFDDYDDMLDYLIFLDKILPGVRYLMNVRDPQDVSRSGWWPDRQDAVASLAMARDRLVDAVADLNTFYGSERAVLVEYERWAEDPSALIDAFAVLGLPSDDEAVRRSSQTHLAHGPHGVLGEEL